MATGAQGGQHSCLRLTTVFNHFQHLSLFSGGCSHSQKQHWEPKGSPFQQEGTSFLTFLCKVIATNTFFLAALRA